MRYLLAALLMFCAVPALAGEIQNFTTVDQYGHVNMGTVIQQPDGSQLYQWNDSTGQRKTDTGYVSPPIGNQRNYSTYDGDTGRSSVGSIYGQPDALDSLFLPQAPAKDDHSRESR